jgi:putative dehydrogenase
MKPIVAIVAPGNMGAAVAKRLTDNGVEVLTTLEGRSAASKQRASDAGMTAVPMQDLARANFLLSILPPAGALAFAEQAVTTLRYAQDQVVFVDCNAVSPRTAQQIGSVISPTGALFIDAGIVGQPPQPGAQGPRFYAAGAHAERLLELTDYGLDVRVLAGPIGAASALKMSFAGINKGAIAIVAAMILAAKRAGAADALLGELGESESAALGSLARKLPSMLSKAHRWVAEMEEIAEFNAQDPLARDLYMTIARLYERIANDVAQNGPQSAALTEFAADL